MACDFIVEADGGSRGNPGPAAYGALVRDADSGEILAELGESVGVATNNVAEYRGAIAGLEFAAALDPQACVEVRLDSKLVVEQMSGRWQIKHPDMKVLAKQARGIFPPGKVTYTWVPREQNKSADSIVNEILDRFDGTTTVTITRTFPRDSLAPAAKNGLSRMAQTDLVGSVQELHTRDIARESISTRPNVVIGWAELGTPVTTHLARHGATEYSLEKRFSGSGGRDLPLASLGVRQGQALAEEVARRNKITRIITSPLLRTQQTAELVSEATGISPVVMDDFAECSFGDWDGYTFAEVRDRWPQELSDWLANTDIAPPGGESFQDCQLRVDRGRREVIAAYPGEHVLIVAHVSPIKVLTAMSVGAPLDSLFRMELPPCSLTTLAWFPDGNSSMFSFGEASHVNGLSAAGT